MVGDEPLSSKDYEILYTLADTPNPFNLLNVTDILYTSGLRVIQEEQMASPVINTLISYANLTEGHVGLEVMREAGYDLKQYHESPAILYLTVDNSGSSFLEKAKLVKKAGLDVNDIKPLKLLQMDIEKVPAYCKTKAQQPSVS